MNPPPPLNNVVHHGKCVEKLFQHWWNVSNSTLLRGRGGAPCYKGNGRENLKITTFFMSVTYIYAQDCGIWHLNCLN